MASHGHPSKNAPSGPLLVHSLHPMQSRGSTSMRPNGGWQVSATQYIQSSTGQYSTQAGEPAHPVQHSLITAIMCGLRLRLVVVPVDFGSRLTTLSAANFAIVGSASVTVRLPLLSVGLVLPSGGTAGPSPAHLTQKFASPPFLPTARPMSILPAN